MRALVSNETCTFLSDSKVHARFTRASRNSFSTFRPQLDGMRTRDGGSTSFVFIALDPRFRTKTRPPYPGAELLGTKLAGISRGKVRYSCRGHREPSPSR